MTKLEATRKFVIRDFNAIDTRIIAKLMEIDPDDWQEVTVTDDDREFYDVLPIWGTMWSFRDSIDEYWLEEKNGLKKMSECGFRIYKSEEFGYFFGIDGCGYDFFESHWIPLYDARGLKWHDDAMQN